MNLTPSLSIPCPDDTDYAAIPLYLQRLAEQTEAMLAARDAQLKVFTEPDLAIWESFDTTTFDTTGTLSTFISETPVYSNYGPPSMDFGSNDPFQAGPGVYQMGYQMRMFPTGAISNDSQRMVEIFVRRITGEGAITVARFGRRLNGLTGVTITDYLSAEALFVVGEDFRSHKIEGQITHTNAASTMTLNYRRAWVMRVSGLDLVEVV